MQEEGCQVSTCSKTAWHWSLRVDDFASSVSNSDSRLSRITVSKELTAAHVASSGPQTASVDSTTPKTRSAPEALD